MKRSIFLPVLALTAWMGVPIPQARGEFRLGVAADDDGIRSFYLGIGEYYHCPERNVYLVHQRGIPYDEMPVVFFISRYAQVPPSVIVDLRLEGWSWDRITVHFGGGPEIYYVPVPVAVIGPPYGRAYGHFKKVPRHRWSTIRLSDSDIVNLVNLRFVSEHNGVPAQDVMQLRSGGKHFRDVYRSSKTAGGKSGKAGGKSGGGGSGHSKGGHGKHGR